MTRGDPAEGQPLTALREDLRIERGAVPGDGGPAPWLLYDPLAHRYYEIDETGLAFLQAWRTGLTPADLADAAGEALGRAVGPDEVAAFRGFCEANGLVAHRGGWQALVRQAASRRHGLGAWLLHNYLFIRIPLVRPQGFLDRTLPVARCLADRRSLAAIALAGLLGLYLAMQQWDTFRATFLEFFTPEGLVFYLAALVAVKALHELGHAYTATHYGCRVPSMGVALMVLVPVLYTDTTDAWRLRDRRQRIAIDGAGVAVELAVAALATLAWSFLPDGTARSVAFFLATTGWVMSVAINLSPLMRFDGYYIAADLFGVSNLQPRAFALTTWALREILFGLGDPCPESWSPRRRWGVIAYGVAVWIYRLVLFTGIAVMVYTLAFKVLGLLLFAVEIGVFVLRPIVRETLFWWRNRRRIAPNGRVRITGAALAVVLLLLVLPVSGRVEIPAIAEPERTERLTAVAASRIETVEVAPGESVSAGQVLMRLRSPALDHDLEAARIRLALVEMKQDRRAADPQDRAGGLVLDGEGNARREAVRGLERRHDELVIRAAFDGIVAEIEPDLHPGRFVGRGEELGTLVSNGRRQVRGLVPEDAMARLYPGASGTFVPDDLTTGSIPVTVTSVSAAAVAVVEIPSLLSTLGGPVAVREEKGVGPVPVEAQYTVVLNRPDDELRLSGTPAVVRGLVTVSGRRESTAAHAFRRIAAVLVRESGF
ncbi:HlyD family efflux transporter periplasmic adaptor subunit [Methylobacterium aquaticum]|uniref:HlyD family efflux transporter periplasmic adaptor subunit n=1 Tax=Methylobacterium aquaticum TaxID=270351 RepID=UPI001931C01F|nr:HlyD family efflux transporter periplasmic adaptor subunit [Methylobacterium aquaticum]QRE72336.1 HlyD family efflux transporter periplasmic adaptor subunit [Methylobacterium aquaticum]